MASTKRRPSRGNKWQARYRDPDGKEHARLFDRRGDAERWLDSVRSDMLRGTYVDPTAGRQTFGDYAKEWQAAQLQHRSGTADTVARHLKNHILPAFEARQLVMIRRAEIQAWVTALASHLAPSTVALVYGYLATILRAAVDDGKLAASPCRNINLPRVETKPVVPLRLEEVRALISAMPDQYRALIVVAVGTGMRQGEVFGLTTPNVDFLRREMRVSQQVVLAGAGGPRLAPPKTNASYRTVPAPAVVLDALAAHLATYPPGENQLIFTNFRGGPIRRNRFNEVWKAAVGRAGLPSGTHFHELRHFYASLLIHQVSSVKVVQARLGHKSATETLDTYGHLWPDSDDDTRAAIDTAFGTLADPTRTRALG